MSVERRKPKRKEISRTGGKLTCLFDPYMVRYLPCNSGRETVLGHRLSPNAGPAIFR